MAFYLEKAIFVNRAPFKHLELDFKEKGISVLSAVNGKGKTTILSYIVDAFFELARKYYSHEFEGRETKYYRVSSSIYNINPHRPSFVYLRFNYDGKFLDYIDVRNSCQQIDYDQSIIVDHKIPFEKFRDSLNKENNIKFWNVEANVTDKTIPSIFNKNIVTYFPSYRYETPSYLNEEFQFKIDHKLKGNFVGSLTNPIEVVTGIKQLANWVLDVVLDWETYKQTQKVKLPNGVEQSIDYSPELNIWKNLNEVIRQTLSSKHYNGTIRLGIGKRNNAGTRISIVADNNGDISTVSPNLFCLSAGESAMLCCFGELLRQADEIRPNMSMEEIQGIVLIDEVDKHLHIKLQKEVLPKMFKLFPNVQFIVSSHSPFMNMGLADEMSERTQLIDLDNNGIVCEPTNNYLYKEVYKMMTEENQRFADKYNTLLEQIKTNSKPIIITEGKTDYRHIRKAITVLGRDDIDVNFYQIPDSWGSSKLKEMLENLSRIRQNRIVVGIFDRDERDFLTYLDVNNQQYKTYGKSNVYALALPLVNEEIYGCSISIEHYYKKESLLKEEPSNHRRLFLGSEFYKSGNSIDGCYQTKTKNISHKVDVNGIIDDKVFLSSDLEQTHSVALTKEAFISLLENDSEYANGFDFTQFEQLLELIHCIIGLPLYQ